SPDFEFIRGDVVQDASLVRRCVAEADAVIHLAAAVGVELVVKEPARTITTNVHGTENVLSPAAEFGKRVIIASTSEVYGKSANDSFAEDDDLIIGPSVHSRWSYACSKLLDEFLLMAHCRAAGLPGTVVRFFNTVGPRQTGRYGMVIPRFVGAALAGKPLQVYGDGQQTRCFCHVADVVEALLLLLGREETYGQVYNIGSTERISIRDLAERVIARTQSTSKIELVPYDIAYAAGFEDMRRRKPNTSKIAALTGWRPKHDLDGIIDDVAADLRGC
ncbi:MAG: GDP-mannose 4,6-dehydratase, partial [Lentisphaeria bacterium]|nr:GDP-mannose 4,6-dehydratase [Lentisphaeria bacterium]